METNWRLPFCCAWVREPPSDAESNALALQSRRIRALTLVGLAGKGRSAAHDSLKSRTLDGPDETRWPCRAWSWSNQRLTALAAHDDARGFRQWREEGRYVREGERGFPILVPCHAKRTVRDDDKGEEREILALVGFRSCVGLEKEADPGGCWEYVW